MEQCRNRNHNTIFAFLGNGCNAFGKVLLHRVERVAKRPRVMIGTDGLLDRFVAHRSLALRLQHAYDHCLGCLPTEPSSSIAFTLEDGDD